MVHGVVLGLHIVAGVAGLLLGPPALMRSGHGQRSPVLAGYQGASLAVCVTALALALLDWADLWPFSLLAVGTGAAVVGGWWVARRRFAGWRGWFVRLTGGSYVSLVTALLVVSWGSLAAWLLPTVIGVPVVERAAARADQRSEVSPPAAAPR